MKYSNCGAIGKVECSLK